MQKVSYAFMNPNDGRFLRVYSTEHEEDCITPYRVFTLDAEDPIYETEEPAAILDIAIGCQNGRYLSKESRSEWLPRTQRNLRIEDYVPVALIRELKPIIPGGDPLTTSMNVRLVRFDDTADPETIWLDDLETPDIGVNSPGVPRN